MSNVEQPEYKVVTSNQDIEIRQYPPMIVAEVEVSGERKQAIREGFTLLANYIFGNNRAKEKIPMTAPVMQGVSEKIAMTAPVMQQEFEGRWKVRFVMPKKYTLETLPKPNSKEVELLSVTARRFVVIRFSGFTSNENIKKHTEKLKAYIVAQNLKPMGGPLFAFYNPPWTLPFLRRNEVMMEIAV